MKSQYSQTSLELLDRFFVCDLLRRPSILFIFILYVPILYLHHNSCWITAVHLKKWAISLTCYVFFLYPFCSKGNYFVHALSTAPPSVSLSQGHYSHTYFPLNNYQSFFVVSCSQYLYIKIQIPHLNKNRLITNWDVLCSHLLTLYYYSLGSLNLLSDHMVLLLLHLPSN